MAKNGQKKKNSEKSNAKKSEKYKKRYGSLPKCVKHSVEEYFRHIDQSETKDFYDLVIHQVEAPLLKVVMRETNDNQSAAAELLGLNRGTLRKKLKLHGLID